MGKQRYRTPGAAGEDGFNSQATYVDEESISKRSSTLLDVESKQSALGLLRIKTPQKLRKNSDRAQQLQYLARSSRLLFYSLLI